MRRKSAGEWTNNVVRPAVLHEWYAGMIRGVAPRVASCGSASACSIRVLSPTSLRAEPHQVARPPP
eukprot:1566310-Prorocentrum_lima.AAC.1